METFITFLLLMAIGIIYWAKDKKNEEAYKVTCENRFYASVFPQYENFFKGALITFADKLKICRGLGSDIESFSILKTKTEYFPTYAVMHFTIMSEGVTITDDFRKRYLKNISRAAEINMLTAYRKKYGDCGDAKGFIETKIRVKSPTEIEISFGIVKNCIYNFDDII